MWHTLERNIRLRTLLSLEQVSHLLMRMFLSPYKLQAALTLSHSSLGLLLLCSVYQGSI